MKWAQALSLLVLSFGLGSFLTLLSCVHSQKIPGMFIDQVPAYYKATGFGFPFPIFMSSAELWTFAPQPISEAQFLLVAALLDILFYAMIVAFIAGAVVSVVPRKTDYQSRLLTSES